MTRREVTVTITNEGRDKGKAFLLTELSASEAEELAIRAFILLEKAGVELPSDVKGTGMQGVALAGLRAFMNLSFEDIRPILVRIMDCVEILPDPGNPNVHRRLVENDIEEVETRLKLKSEVFTLHTGFSLGGVIQK